MDKLAEALRDSTFVAAMLDAICETDGTVDRMRARDAAYRVREALQAHAAEAAQAAVAVAVVECNANGQIRLATPSGDAFDMSRYVGARLYTIKTGELR